MRGLSTLIDARRRGLKPADTLWVFASSASTSANPDDLVCEPRDVAETIDLRAFVGLPVMVVGKGFGGFEEAECWVRAMIKAGADSVGLLFAVPADHGYWDGPVWVRVRGETLA